MGEWFTSFDDAWSSFLAREEPLELFFDEFPDDPSFVAEGWLVVPPPEVKREILRVQGALEDVRGLRIVPHHFLHLWLRGEDGADVDALAEHGPFDVALERIGCFHTAVVAEARADALDAVDAPDTFLPHVSLAYVELPIGPDDLRPVLLPLRERSLGSWTVDEVLRVRLPAGRTTILEPWTVVERLRLRR